MYLALLWLLGCGTPAVDAELAVEPTVEAQTAADGGEDSPSLIALIGQTDGPGSPRYEQVAQCASKGLILLEMVHDEQGRVSRATVMETTMPDEAAACVIKAAKTWRNPPDPRPQPTPATTLRFEIMPELDATGGDITTEGRIDFGPPPIDMGLKPVLDSKLTHEVVSIELDAGAQSDVEAVIRRASGQMKFCHEKQLKVNPAAIGHVEITWVISAGKATTVEVSANDTNDTDLGDCVKAKVQRIRFPADIDGRAVWRFTFATT
jgi:hypothetical protein